MKSVKKMAITLLGLMLLISLATPVHAEITTATPFETASKMYQLGIIQGRGVLESGEIDFDLGSNLTRAELVTIIVRSFGAEQAAQMAKGAPSFADVNASDWFSGYVAVAKNLAEQAGTTIGRDEDTFDPNANVSKAETLVFVMKYLGIQVEQTGGAWYEAWVRNAIEHGMISEADAALLLSNPGAPSTRGEAFVVLDNWYSSNLLEGGSSLYTAFVDSTRPIVTLDSYPEVTNTSEVILSGTASDDKGLAAMSISNGTSRSEIAFTEGRWQATVSLKPGLNAFTIEAVDIAGNTASAQVNIERIAVDRLQIKNKPSSLSAGYLHSFEAVLLDAQGNTIQTEIPVTWSASGGSIDQSGRFISHESGTYTITATWGELVDTVQVYVTAPTPYFAPSPVFRIHPASDLEWCEGDVVNVILGADVPIDASGSARFSVSGLPWWLALNERTGELSGNVPYDAAGEYNLTVTLEATGYQTSTTSFKITVLNTDTMPYWSISTPFQTTWTDPFVVIYLDSYAHDEDGDELIFEGVELDPNLVLYGNELCITDPGIYEVTIKVRDNTPSEDPSLDEATVTFTLIVENV
jgi:Putative Ig domain.